MTKLLIVDDNEQNLYMLQILLQGHGYEVIMAANGAEALEAARNTLPDVIISDILMPVMDGFALCRAWKQDDQLKEIPFVFYTATYTDPKDENFALSLGADRFIIKPQEPETLIQMFEEVIKEYKKGRLVVSDSQIDNETIYIKQYNQALIRKLEDKMLKLEATNQALEEDIAKRIQAEKELRHVNWAYKLLSSVNQVLVRATNETALLQEICRLIIETGGYRTAWVGYVKQDEETGLDPAAYAGFEGDAFDSRNATWDDSEHGRHATETAARTGRLCVNRNVLTDPRYASWRGEAVKYQYASSIALPLTAGETTLGVLTINSTDPNAFNKKEIDLLLELASDLAYGIVTLRVRAKQAQTERKIRRRNRELALLNHIIMTAASTLDTSKILQVTCRELARTFGLPQAAAGLLNEATNELDIVAEYLEPGRPSVLGKTIALDGNPATQYVLTRKEPLVIPDAQTDERTKRHRSLWRERGLVTLLIVPITVREKAIGTIGLDAIERREFTADEITLAQSVATAVGQSLETARLHQALQRHVDDLEETVTQRTAELTAALEKARAADHLKSQFISDVNHELRTPLSNIKLYLGLLEQGRPENQPRYMEVLNRETDRLQRLIEELLDISRLDTEQVAANLKPTDVNRLVSLLAADRKELIADQQLTLNYDVRDDVPQALADSQLLFQVLTNLLANAINYTPAGGTITLRTGTAVKDNQSWVTISVADNGPGIAESDLPYIFDRFYRGETARAGGVPGTGLGLSICQEIMKRHSGHILVDSDKGKGSAFTLYLKPAPETQENV